jgi:RNA polymerase sigma-70 factor (ECF subfamily)
MVAAQRIRAQVQETSWSAFWRTAVDGRAPGDVANELNLSLGALYTAKSRVLALIKKEIQTLVEE